MDCQKSSEATGDVLRGQARSQPSSGSFHSLSTLTEESLWASTICHLPVLVSSMISTTFLTPLFLSSISPGYVAAAWVPGTGIQWRTPSPSHRTSWFESHCRLGFRSRPGLRQMFIKHLPCSAPKAKTVWSRGKRRREQHAFIKYLRTSYKDKPSFSPGKTLPLFWAKCVFSVKLIYLFSWFQRGWAKYFNSDFDVSLNRLRNCWWFTNYIMSFAHSFIFYLSVFYSVQDFELITVKETNMNNKFLFSGLVTKKTTIQPIITV